MGQINLLINGRDYRLACEDGQESRLQELVQRLDRQLTELKTNFGEIGENRLTVMAAIKLADELDEQRRNMEIMETELGALRAKNAPDKMEEAEDIIAEAFLAAAERIERLTVSLSAGPS
jgi:cell division protein ZapA